MGPKTPHLTVAAFLSWRDNNPVTVCSIRRPRSRGFTLLEVVVTLGIFALIFTGAVSLLTQPLEFDRENQTVDTLKALKRATIGDPDVVSAEVRTDFGFIGPMGNIPPITVGPLAAWGAADVHDRYEPEARDRLDRPVHRAAGAD